MTARYRAGVDIGGTFTDLILLDPETGRFRLGKTLTTPGDPSQAVETVLQDALAAEDLSGKAVADLVHGTTLVTNAMIERTGAVTALITTEGFRDVLEIGRESRYDLYDLMLERPRPLVPRRLRFEVPQRTRSDGTRHRPLDEAAVRALVPRLRRAGVEAVAVVFLHSFRDPTDEQRVAALLAEEAPELRVSLSSDVVPEIREYERTSTTVANVYVQARVEAYLRRLQERMAAIGLPADFRLMLSGGGTATVDTAVRHPVRLLESGPAAGALAAAAVGEAIGERDLISFDMGGTTAKICVIDEGRPLLAPEFEVDRVYRFARGSGLPIKLPVVELIEIGTGGGSIARVDALGLLKAGPDSAGAAPGPACYGRGGTRPTITDANLVLGYLSPGSFLGGRMTLDLAAAREAVERHVADPLDLSIEEAAWGIHQIANENMANAARVHALERGKDPRRFPLFAFGGAGPAHADRVARALGSPRWIAPYGAGVMSALGFLTAPPAFDFVRSHPTPLADLVPRTVESRFADMEAEGLRLLSDSGVPRSQIVHRREVDMRYVGQGHEIRVAWPADGNLQASFEATYRALYARGGPDVPVEILNWRVTSAGPQPNVTLSIPEGSRCASAHEARTALRPAYFPEASGFVETAVYDRYRLGPGATFAGPAVVEEAESTVVVGPGALVHVDERHNLVVEPS